MYLLIEQHKTSARILQVCNSTDLKYTHLDNELRRNLIRLVKHKDDMTQDGLYCVKSDTNVNRYNVVQCENTPDGYIYKGERIIKYLYDLEWVFYKTDETSIYKTLLNAELTRYANTVNKSLTITEVRAGKIRSRARRARQQSPHPPDVTAENYGT